MNKFKGEVALPAGDKTYMVRFTANALCEMEEALGMGINQIATQLADVANMRIKTVRAMLWAGLRDAHRETTLQAAGEILDEASLTTAMETISKAFALAFEDKTRPASQAEQRPTA